MDDIAVPNPDFDFISPARLCLVPLISTAGLLSQIGGALPFEKRRIQSRWIADGESMNTRVRCSSLQFGSVPQPSAEVSWCQWFAVFTVPQNEKSVIKHLQLRGVNSFLPTYETTRVWKNRQRVKILLPLFPCYLFVHIDIRERVKVLQAPGVLRIVGSGQHYQPLNEADIEMLRSGISGKKFEPFRELVVGERVRIKAGLMQGLEGVLVRRNNNLRFVLSLDLINQHAAVEIDADALEPVVNA